MDRRRRELLWPAAEERRLLTRFYAATALDQALYLIFPFQFAYLYLVMRRPEWAVLPSMAASATALVGQLPTGALADRWSRKGSVILGGALAAVSFAAVPWAVGLPGGWQLAGTCGAFALTGLGETLMAGAEEAWVVDNLLAAGRRDLVDAFFARVFAVGSVGGVIGGSAALSLLLLLRVDRGLLDLLWYVTAAGFLASTALVATIEERRYAGSGGGAVRAGHGGLFGRMSSAFGTLFTRRVLLYLGIALILASLSSAACNDAFPVSLLTKGLDARLLAPLGIAEDLAGIVAPLIGLALARRLGAEPVLAVTLVVAGAAVTAVFVSQALALLVVLYVGLGFVDRLWDPVALARIQDEIPSAQRAAISSLLYQAGGIAELGGLGLFALMLGSHSAQLHDATPDLVEAFSGSSHVSAVVPTGWFGLPVPDVAIIVFVLAGVAAVPFIVLAGRAGRSRRGARRGAGARGARSSRIP